MLIRSVSRRVFVITLVVGIALLPIDVSAQELLINGDFETGDSTGWSIVVLAGSAGTFNIHNSTTPPLGGTAGHLSGPAAGTWFAVTDQADSGTYALIQLFAVPIGIGKLEISFELFADSHAPGAVDAAGLDHTVDTVTNPNQHARVDILTVAATAFATGALAVVTNLYIG
ncbi:MAG: hypothetical protein V3T05_08275, partial [Myxococcota bacterium]